MHSDRLLDSLNDAQRAAVAASPGPILVLAGAGSGKTRVLAHRIAWLLATGAANPSSILAVTFTNKAAREVRGRIETLCGMPPGSIGWIGTFHSLCHRLLRLHWQDAKLPQTFQVLDSDDQLRQIRRILRDLQLDESKFVPRQVAAFINSHKDEGQRAGQLQPADNNPYERGMTRIYTVYEQTCDKGGLVDFAELLLRAYELLRDNLNLLAHYQGRFRHLLVDEFQDTNNLQYAWLRLLAGNTGYIFVVGDDDQCLVAGTDITMANGSVQPIEYVQAGDWVLSSHGDGKFLGSLVTNCYKKTATYNLVTLHLRSGRTLTSTAEHTHFANQPHYIPQWKNSNRHKIIVTLCADRRDNTPMHRLTISGNDPDYRQSLEELGIQTRNAPTNSQNWHGEMLHQDFGVLMTMAHNLHAQSAGQIIKQAQLLTTPLTFIAAMHMQPGMVMVTEHGKYDVVESIETHLKESTVYDLNIAHTHNFIANGLITHNSIYGWRGARIENIQQFSTDFPGTQTFRLEQNYRSTATILEAANKLIAHNRTRLGKQLWTAGQAGEALLLYVAITDMEEARFVVERIQDWITRGGGPGDGAILYRSNAQSRLFEQELSRVNLPFQVYGGLRFYDRAEVKDTIAYLRLINNRDDDAAFERIVNTPTRAIGDRTVENLRILARTTGISLWRAAVQALQQQQLAARAAHAVAGFLNLIDELALAMLTLELHEMVDHIVIKVGLLEYYKKEDRLAAEAREENLAELVNAAREFTLQDPDPEQRLPRFLSEAALGTGDAGPGGNSGEVQLMTIHSAKGLEFPLVFMVGMEENLFPHARSVDNTTRLEEERRLCYVGMTRAERQLILAYSEQRRLHGSLRPCLPSRFLEEIPAHLVKEIRMRGSVTRPISSYGSAFNTVRTITAIPKAITSPAAVLSAPKDLVDSLQIGQWVRHPRFGDGVVLHTEGSGPKGRVEIQFADHGTKWLVLGYAPIQKI